MHDAVILRYLWPFLRMVFWTPTKVFATVSEPPIPSSTPQPRGGCDAAPPFRGSGGGSQHRRSPPGQLNMPQHVPPSPAPTAPAARPSSARRPPSGLPALPSGIPIRGAVTAVGETATAAVAAAAVASSQQQQRRRGRGPRPGPSAVPRESAVGGAANLAAGSSDVGTGGTVSITSGSGMDNATGAIRFHRRTLARAAGAARFCSARAPPYPGTAAK